MVSAVDPYPTDAGKKIVLAGFNEYFVDRLGRENVHYLMVGGRSRPGFPTQLHVLPKPHSATALGNIATRTFTGRASIQESLLRSRAVGDAIRGSLERLDADLEIYDTIRMAQYAPTLGRGRQICYLDDLFSERYRSMLEAARRFRDVDVEALGNFATHVPRPLQPLATHRIGQQVLLKFEQHLVRRSEHRSVERFTTSLLVNETEAELLRSSAGAHPARVRSIPPLITEPPVFRDYRGTPEFVFLGLLSLPHNDDGLRSFLSEVWPRVLKSRPDAVLRVIGRHARPGLIAEAARHGDSVILEGFVPDLNPLLGRAAALVNPLRFGSGVKLKVIEALGRGVPVVSTSIGAVGVARGADQGVLVADAPVEMAEIILGTIDPARNVELSAAARAHFSQCYSRAAVFDCYDRIFGLG